jgi:hypothetical protein
MSAPFVIRTIAGARSAARLGGHVANDPRLESDDPGGANEIGPVRPSFAQRQLAGEPHRIGGDAIIGDDAAQGAQPWVERRRLGARRQGLNHCRSSLFPRAAGFVVIARSDRASRDAVFRPGYGDEAIQRTVRSTIPGLFRFARNDGDRATLLAEIVPNDDRS